MELISCFVSFRVMLDCRTGSHGRSELNGLIFAGLTRVFTNKLLWQVIS